MRIFNIQKLFRGGKGKMHYLFLLFTMVTLLTVLPAIGFAQSFASADEQTTSWGTSTDWTGIPNPPTLSFLAGNPDVSGSNIKIQGTVNTVGSLTISTNVELVVTSGDTIIINGNLNIVSGGSLSLQVQAGAYFFLLGDFDIQSGAVAITFDVTGGGFFGVRGNYTENVTPTGGLNSSTEYIIGIVTGTHISSSSSSYPSTPEVVGNRAALIAQAALSTRKILLGVQALGASCAVSSAITCNGGTGAITATASGGSYNYQYRLSDGVNSDIYYPSNSSYTSDASHTFSGLTQNAYTIDVRDDDVPQGSNSCSINLPEPALLDVSVGSSSQDWSCASPCNGTLNLIITGGTPPYAITGTAANVAVNSFTSNNASNGSLCADSYTINVKDANVATCPTSDITLTDPFVVLLDNAAPTGCNVPANEFLSLADYNALVSTINLPVQSHQFSEGPSNYIFTLNGSSNLIDRTLNLNILREGSGTWDNSDVITVDTSYNGGTSYTQAFSVTGGTDAIPTTLTLNNSAVDVQVRVTVTTGIGKNFNVSDIQVSGNGVAGPDLTGCSDNPGQTITQSYSATINWLCANEFVVTRSWSVSDGCGNSGSYAQTIAVGEYPTFTGPAQTYTYDFCHPNQTITCPTFTDGCDPAPTVSYVIIDDITTAQFKAGTGSPFTYSFPVPTQNDTIYTVRWTVTDQAGFSTSINETVTILKPMQITLTPVAGDEDFCDGEEVNFNVSVVGGTGAYAVPTFTPASSDAWSSLDGNVSGLYTTNGLVWNSGSGTPIVINYTDADNLGVTGGCSTSATFNNGSGFTVHPNITTNGISRMP